MKSIREILDLRHKKSLRIGVLILSTLLIGTVSATVYYSLQTRTNATTSSAVVKLISGTDSTSAGASINTVGTYASLAIKTYPNATVTYQQALNISNTDSIIHKVRLNSQSVSGGQGSYSNSTSNIQFSIVALNGTAYGPVTYKGANGGSPWTTTCTTGSCATSTTTVYIVVPASTKFAIQVVATADATAVASVTTTIVINIDVQ